MNRLVILGNGFDLAHGLPTRYEDFMLHYLKDVFKKRHDASGLIKFFKSPAGDNWNEVINNCFSINDLMRIVGLNERFVRYRIESKLIENLINNLKDYNWVDIETEYYRLLKECFEDSKKTNLQQRYNRIKFTIEDINKDFEILKNLLEKYLLEEVEQKHEFIPSEKFVDIFLEWNYNAKKKLFFGSRYKELPSETLFLNFNYTTLANIYSKFIRKENERFIGQVNFIHGELDNEENPIIFGFGDEIDKNYQEIEELNDNEYFEHIKSFRYLKTSNYQDLIRFLDASTKGYEIFIIGHSCGLSDRTLLNHVFEHENCDSIKIYYHEDLKGYTNTVHEISRHFKNKAQMRTKIIPFDKSMPTPQVQLHKK